MPFLLPDLNLPNWEATRATLHMWTQIVGKVRLELSPMLNHWWQVPLYVTACGLSTSVIPYRGWAFEIEFDFTEHLLQIRTSERTSRTLSLYSRSVADFYAEFMAALHALKIDVEIYAVPVEVPDPIPFADDEQHASYDAEYANRLWRALLFSDLVLKEFRGRFQGKHSPVHFFWGGFDIASSRFCGRTAPERQWSPELQKIMQEAYSHEVSSAGFWAGGAGSDPLFYAYHTPEPIGYRECEVKPEAAYFHETLGEFVLPYTAVRLSSDPKRDVLDFLQSTYEAGADCAEWDRASLERPTETRVKED
jgi:hypothetical protein